MVLETCNTIIHSKVNDLEYWLAGLERVAKATILGHLLPVLLTAMTHHNLRCLLMADALMPQLVQLVVLTSQVRPCFFRGGGLSPFVYVLFLCIERGMGIQGVFEQILFDHFKDYTDSCGFLILEVSPTNSKKGSS